MLISFDPTITGGFVHKIMRDEKIADHMKELGIDDEQSQHNLIKEILIAGFRDYEVDFNKLISTAKRQAKTIQDQSS